MEDTIATTFVKSANLRGLLLKNGCPSAIRNCEEFFKKLVNPKVRNTLLTDISAFYVDIDQDEASTLPPESTSGCKLSLESHRLLSAHLGQHTSMKAKSLIHFTRNGYTFSKSSLHKGNGSIIFLDRPSLSQVPAQIEEIVQLSDDVYFIVQKYQRCAAEDPFKPYPALQTSLWRPTAGNRTMVHLNDVLGHFASLPFDLNGSNWFAVVSLVRVSPFFFQPDLCSFMLAVLVAIGLVSLYLSETFSLPAFWTQPLYSQSTGDRARKRRPRSHETY